LFIVLPSAYQSAIQTCYMILCCTEFFISSFQEQVALNTNRADIVGSMIHIVVQITILIFPHVTFRIFIR